MHADDNVQSNTAKEMTKEELDGIDEITKEATPGPWIVIKANDGSHYVVRTLRKDTDGNRINIADVDSGIYAQHCNDARFIAASRYAVPLLIDRVRSLEIALKYEMKKADEMRQRIIDLIMV